MIFNGIRWNFAFYRPIFVAKFCYARFIALKLILFDIYFFLLRLNKRIMLFFSNL